MLRDAINACLLKASIRFVGLSPARLSHTIGVGQIRRPWPVGLTARAGGAPPRVLRIRAIGRSGRPLPSAAVSGSRGRLVGGTDVQAKGDHPGPEGLRREDNRR